MATVQAQQWNLGTWRAGPNDCSTKDNPFLQHLRENGVGMLRSPSKLTNHCKAEWGVFGTCCDPSQVVRYMRGHDHAAQLENSKIKSSAALSVERMHLLLEKLKQYSGNVHAEVVKSFGASVADFEKYSKQMLDKEAMCMASMRKIVGAAVCSACSPRAAELFEGKKAHLREDDCRKIIADCGEGWKFIFRMRKVGAEYQELLKDKKLQVRSVSLYLPEISIEGSEWTNGYDLEKGLSECSDPKSEQKCPFATAQRICESMINIFKPSYVSKFTSPKPVEKGRVLGCAPTSPPPPSGPCSSTSEVQVQQRSRGVANSTTINTADNEMP